jgi:hypothetical protein
VFLAIVWIESAQNERNSFDRQGAEVEGHDYGWMRTKEVQVGGKNKRN